MALSEIREAGLRALERELGPVNLVRFLQQFELGRGDYTSERHKILGDDSIETIVENARSLKQK